MLAFKRLGNRPEMAGENEQPVESMWKRNFTERSEQQDGNQVRISRGGGRVEREQESVFAQGSVGDDKTEAS